MTTEAREIRHEYYSAQGGVYAVAGDGNPNPAGTYLQDVVMERILGRPLALGEAVEHVNGDALDNTRANLRLIAIEVQP